MPRDDRARISDIVEAGARIEARMRGMTFEKFIDDDTVIRAVLYDLAVIGEAAKGVTGETRLRFAGSRGLKWQVCATL